MVRLAFLISGTGGNALNLLLACREGRLDALPVIAVSSSAKAAGVERLRAAGLQVEVVLRSSFASDDDFSGACFSKCEGNTVDIICLCGFLKKLVVPENWMGRILNIHPGPLPRFGGVGMYGHHVHKAVLEAGVSESGPTVHLVDNEFDHGDILGFEPVPVLPGDNAELLQKRVYEAEMRIYPKVLQEFLNKYSAKGK
ncbi:MAG: phosphoribosylglycinamide formyltransferase [Holophagaceae bacterium]|nr:phosphoribosylglycinamide formyltransferase [Holophagaceae bacterium]